MSDVSPSHQPVEPTNRHGARPRFRLMILAFLVAVAVSFGVFVFWNSSEPVDTMLAKGGLALAQRDYASAQQMANRVLTREPGSTKALLLAGEAVTGLGRPHEALRYYERVPDDGSSDAVTARCAAGELLIRKLKQMSAAELQFRRAIEQDPEHILANDRMAYILGLETRTWELVPYQLAMIRSGDISPRRLYILSLSDKFQTDDSVVKQYLDASPEDAGSLLARANWAFMVEQDHVLAERLLRKVIHARGDLAEAQVKLGRVLLAAATETKFLAWHAKLPEHADQHPGIWAIRGSWAQQQKEYAVSARCFWEAIRRDPNHQQATYQLGQVLIALDRPEQAVPFLERSRLLQDYSNAVYINIARTSKEMNAPELRRAAELAESLDLLWEAYGWSYLLSTHSPRDNWARKALVRLESRLPDMSPSSRAIATANPALDIDLSDYSLPDWSAGPAEHDDRRHADAGSVSHPTFADHAPSAGLNFTYFNSANPQIRGLSRMYEFTGGGTAVLDFDGDGNPDIYLTQGCLWPPQENQRDYIDRLYRNLGNGRFEDVTAATGITEDRYSQGVSVGDFNDDGFPDLYIGNIGENSLYRNNGDGTFTDVTDETGTAGRRWTTSCLIADFNGDGWPDIYAVNYLSGRDIFTRACRSAKGVLNTCLPQNFSAAQDQLYFNLGDGRFENITLASGIRVPDGKGMGIVAADFDGSGRLSLFVANDGVANFYFANKTEVRGNRPKFVEQALTLGLAANYEGRIEACMGVAVGDADGDGLLDMFATNYTEESNTLYLQQPGNLFIDATARAGLRAPSMNMLGFGTQFVDSELDGLLDLIVTNGHVDDATPQFQYKMPPQYFQNRGGGQFAELSAKQLGSYFAARHRGRGMARLDWNRDGLEDVVITHLDAPVALLTNTTSGTGHFLAVKLVAVRSARDAIGTTVTIRFGERTLVRQLVAGDGYQASNERLLTFGLGSATRVDKLQVRWPSGRNQEFVNLPVDVELLFVEGSAQRTVLRAAP